MSTAFSRTLERMRGLTAGEIVAELHPIPPGTFRRASPIGRLEGHPLPAYKGPPHPFQIRPAREGQRNRTTGDSFGERRDTEARVELVVGYLDGNVDDLEIRMIEDSARLLRLHFSSRNWDKDVTGCELCEYQGTVYQAEPDGARALMVQTWRLELHDSWGTPV